MTNVYKVGIELSLINSVSRGLALIAAEMTGLERKVGSLNSAFAGFLKGGIFIGGAWEISKALMSAASHADKLFHTMRTMENQGWDKIGGAARRASNLFGIAPTSDVMKAHELAWNLSGQYKTLGYESTLEMLQKMAPVMGSREHSLEIADTMAKFSVLVQGTMGAGANVSEQVEAAVKALELKGVLLDPTTGAIKADLFKDYVSGMGQTLAATKGFIKPSDYFQFMKQARASGVTMDKDFFLRVAPTLMNEMGAMRSGTGMMAMFQALIGGQLTKRSAEVLTKQGIISKDLLGSYGAEGLTPQKFGQLMEDKGFLSNPFKWFGLAKEMLEAKAGHSLTQVELIKEMSQWFGNRTAQGMADVLMSQRAKIERNMGLYDEAKSLDEAIANFAKAGKAGDPLMAKLALDMQEERAWVAIGEALAPIRVDVLQGLANFFTTLGEFAHSHGEEIANVSKGIGALALGMGTLGGVFVGEALLGALGPAGWLVGGFTALAVAFHALKPELSGMLSDLGTWLSKQPEKWGKEFGSERRNELYHMFVDPWGRAFGSDTDAPTPETSRRRHNLFHQSSWDGSPQGLLQNASWEPQASGGRTETHIHNIHIDGERITQVVTRRMADNMEMTRSAAFFDAWRGYADPGAQILTT